MNSLFHKDAPLAAPYLHIQAVRILDFIRIEIRGQQEERLLWQCGIDIRIQDVRGKIDKAFLEATFTGFGREVKKSHKLVQYRFAFPAPVVYGDIQATELIPGLWGNMEMFIDLFQANATTTN